MKYRLFQGAVLLFMAGLLLRVYLSPPKCVVRTIIVEEGIPTGNEGKRRELRGISSSIPWNDRWIDPESLTADEPSRSRAIHPGAADFISYDIDEGRKIAEWALIVACAALLLAFFHPRPRV